MGTSCDTVCKQLALSEWSHCISLCANSGFRSPCPLLTLLKQAQALLSLIATRSNSSFSIALAPLPLSQLLSPYLSLFSSFAYIPLPVCCLPGVSFPVRPDCLTFQVPAAAAGVSKPAEPSCGIGSAVKQPDQILALSTGIVLLSNSMKYRLLCAQNKEWQSNCFLFSPA